MYSSFGFLPDGREARLFAITGGGVTAAVTDLGASLVQLLLPGSKGEPVDVVLGYDTAAGYLTGSAFLGATVGRCANRIAGASFPLGEETVCLTANEGRNSLHSGPDYFHLRLWQVVRYSASAVTFCLDSPHGDQGFPGAAVIRVTYALEAPGTLAVTYEARSDRDTVFNLTNHSYFNLAGHDHPELALNQTLQIAASCFTPADGESIPTGELRQVDGTPMDFRTPKPIGRDLAAAYEPLRLQGGYDHNFPLSGNPCAVLADPSSGRSLTISTDCPGLQFYSGNGLHEHGKGGTFYGPHSGMALETQFFPDALHHPQWAQPVTPAGTLYRSRTRYRFGW